MVEAAVVAVVVAEEVSHLFIFSIILKAWSHGERVNGASRITRLEGLKHSPALHIKFLTLLLA